MLLRTLGNLSLEQTDLQRTKPLVVLGYLALEGPKPRHHLAELFWSDANNPLGSLSITLSRLRPVLGSALTTTDTSVSTSINCDAQHFLRLLESASWEEAVALYQGHFLENVSLSGWSSEVQEWVHQTRDFFAARMSLALLHLGEKAAASGNFDVAARRAEHAVRLGQTAGFESETLARTYDLLVAGESPLVAPCRQEAKELGLQLTWTAAEAKQRLYLPSIPKGRLPRRELTFVGRGQESELLLELLTRAEMRLVTVVGLAGVGKTQLSLYVAEEAARRGLFADGVAFADLESLAPSELAFGVANALGVALDGPDLAAQLADAVGARDLLVVMDSFEHLLDESALLSTFTSRCPNLTLLVTSRERLNLAEEWLVPLEGLPFPDAPDDSERGFLLDAPHLFLLRARRVRPDFTPTERDLEAIGRICKQVEGLPLAIKLTAAWVRALSCEAIAEELETSPAFLVSPARDLPERHRSMWGALERTWSRLSRDEAATMRQLAAFRGGFSREAASEVASAPLATLVSLIDKSLLRVSPTGRYDRHALVYSYSQEKLAQVPDEEAQTRARHADFYARFLASVRNAIDGPKGKAFLDKLDEELPNVELAWYHDLETGRLQALEAASEVLRRFFGARGRALEGIALFSTAIATLERREETGGTLGQLLACHGYLLQFLGMLDQGKESIERSVHLLEPRGAHANLARAHVFLAYIERASGALPAAREHLEHALSLVRALGDMEEEARVLGGLAMVESDLGNYVQAKEAFVATIALERKLGQLSTEMLYNLGALLLASDQFVEAEGPLHESLRLCLETNYKGLQSYILYAIGVLEQRKGDTGAAERYLREALSIAEANGDQAMRNSIYSDLALVVHKANYPLAATYLLRAMQGVQGVQGVRALPLLLRYLIDVAEVWLEQGRSEASFKVLSGVGIHPALRHEDQQRRVTLLDRVTSPFLVERGQVPTEGEGARELDVLVAEVVAELGAEAHPPQSGSFSDPVSGGL